MAVYMLSLGHNVTPTVALDPQPRTLGMPPTRRTRALSGLVIDELPYVTYEFDALEDDVMYRSLLTQCGLLTATTSLVSVYIQDQNYDWVTRNGIIIKPEIGADGQRQDYFFKDFAFIVHSLRIQA